jgi:hypothetical protein
VPAGWYVDVTSFLDPCRKFAPSAFGVCRACDGPFDYGTTTIVAEPPQPVSTPSETVVSTASTTVAGRAATVTEMAATGAGLFPADYRTYRYVVDWSPNGALVVSIGGMPSPEFDARKAGLDAIAASVRRLD